MKEYIVITITVILIWIVLVLLKRALHKQFNKVNHIIAFTIFSIIEFWLLLLAASGFIVFNFFITWHLAYVELALVIVLTTDFFLNIIKGLVALISHLVKRKFTLNSKVWGLISLLSTIAYLIYGLFNMYDIRQVNTSYESERLSSEHRIIYMADLHVEDEIVLNHLDSLVDMINKTNSELVILGGDIVDEYTSKDVMLKTFEKLSQIDADLYFIYGNHDRQIDYRFLGGSTFTPEELEDTIAKNGIRIIKDEYIDLGDLVLLGRDDLTSPTRKPLSTMTNPSPDKFLILLDHQPTEIDDLIASQAQLQLSGHTHAGQIFPMGTLSEAIRIHTLGTFRYEDSLLYISAGEHGWRIPFRSENHSVYECITLVPR